MRKLNLLLALLFVSIVSGFSQVDSLKNKPILKFEKMEYDFGTITQGSNGTFELSFTNEGNEPLIITEVKKQCGCTATDWIKEPVLKGKKGFIRATYNTQLMGSFHKGVTVMSNSKTPILNITFKGTVVEAPKTSPAVQPASTIENSK